MHKRFIADVPMIVLFNGAELTALRKGVKGYAGWLYPQPRFWGVSGRVGKGRGMLGYLARRLLMTIPTLLLVAVAVFVLIRLIPGDPAQVMLGDAADPAQAAQLRAQLGLDQPIPVQFCTGSRKLATGDFGHSITNNLAVLPLILERFQVSAVIVLVAVAAAACIAVPAGLDRRLEAEQRCSTSRSSAAPRCCCRSRASGSACCCCCSSA